MTRQRGRGPCALSVRSTARRIAILLVVSLSVVLAPAPAESSGPTNVSGTISTNTTWTLANSPYVMTGDVTVASGVTLTIEPGVVVKGNAQTRVLNVSGTLSAVGTSAAHITFTSSSDSAAGQWGGVTFASGSGSSTLDYVDVRYGGDGGASQANGMVSIDGGTITVDHSTFTSSTTSGMRVNGGSTGANELVTIKHTKFENNGYSGSFKQGNGLYSFNGRVVVEDSAFWSNATDGIHVEVSSGYTQSPSQVSGSSIWNNKRFGVYIFQDSSVASLGLDGYVSGKPSNAVYDNGTFGFTVSEAWNQLSIVRSTLDVDWSHVYWGPVTYIPCNLGTQAGHVSYNVPDPDPGALFPITRGPVPHTFDYVVNGGNITYCGNDQVKVDPPVYEQPDLYFDAPPPTFGGLLSSATWGCTDCQISELQNALAFDRVGKHPFAYTGMPVNTATGSLTEDVNDIGLPGPGIPFRWTRSYNSGDTTAGGLGVGWAHPFEAKLTVVNQTTGELEYRAGTGQRTRFTKISGGSSGSATYGGKGFDGVLKRLSDNSYQMTTRDQRVYLFDTSGNLTSIKPRFRPATTLSYTSGKLTSITDSAGRSISITYTVSDPTLIDKVTLPDGRYVQYGYTSGKVTSVRDLRGKTSTMTYDGNGRLTSIQDASGNYEIQGVQYDSQGRVTSEQDGVGNTMSYAYSTSSPYDVTTVTVPGRGDWVYKHVQNELMSVTDPLGNTTSYTYDGMGRKATVTDPRGNTTRFEYDQYGNVKKEIAPASLGYTIQRTFNATNDLLTEQDGRGNTTTYVYATSASADYQTGQLQTVTDRESGVRTYKWWTTTSSPTPPSTNVGLLKSVTNERSKTTSYDYDSSGNLTKVTSPLGLKTTFGYDSSGRLTSRRDPRGNVPNPPSGYLTQWTYDDANNVKTITDPRGNVTTFDYLDSELLQKITKVEDDSTQRVTTFDYDGANRLWKTTFPRTGVETRLYWADGQLKSVQSPEGRKTSYDYDSGGELTTLVEPDGNATGGTPSDYTWTYGYDASGNRTSEAHPDGGTTQISYDALNRPTQWTDPLSHSTSVTYDANDNVTQRTDGLSHSQTYTYDKLDRLKTATDERSKTWTYAYFATGQLQSVTSPLGNKTTYGLDDDGRTTSMVEPRGNVTGGTPSDYTWTYAYDENGNRTRVTDPLSNYVQYAYDSVDDVTQVTDQRSNATALAYDSMNRLKSVTPPAAGGTGTLSTSYTYDGDGNLASRTDPNGHVTSWTYDLDGLPTKRTTPIGDWNLTYDSNGNLTKLETPAGSSTQTAGDGTITYGYDRMSRQTSADYSDSTPDVSRTYDSAGRITSMSDGSGSVSYTYDAADRLTDATRSSGGSGLNGTFHYDYDNAGDVTGRTYPDSATSSATFDDDGRIASVTSSSATTSFGYDAAGNVTTVTAPSGNGYVATRTFDRAGRLTGVDNAKSGTSLSKFVWTLDAAGNPTKAQTTRGGTDTYDVYGYDTRNRLTASCFGVASSATDCSGAANSITYSYDKVSNRTQEVRTGNVGNTGTISSSYNSSDELTSTTLGGSTTNYTYDANGNLASIGSRTFTYDLASRLVSTTSSGTTTTYSYDGNDRRLSSSTGGGGADLRYTWDELAPSGIAEVALERTSAGSLVRRYLDGPLGAVSFTNSSDTYYMHADPLGSVTDVTDSSGTAQWRYSYEAYGAERDATNVSGSAPSNRLRFQGQYLDSEISQYDLRAREYDPATGRFGARDPIESPFSAPYDGAYVYVDGRPTALADPVGLSGFPCPGCGWVKKQVEKHTPSLQTVSDTAAGFGDTVTFGGTRKVRGWLGTNDAVNFNSRAYGGGGYVGLAAGLINPEEGGGLLCARLARATEEGAGVAERGVVIGRDMSGRVIPYAERHGYGYYKGTPRWVPFRNQRVDLWFNRRWIRGEMRHGSRVVDIGEPPGMPPSVFYDMERSETRGYPKYVQDPQP